MSLTEFYDSHGAATVVLKKKGMPVFWPNLFSTIVYRNTQKSPNTIKKVLRTLGYCYEWAESEHIDLDHLLSCEQFLSINDVERLANFLKLRSSAQQKVIDAHSSTQHKRLLHLESVRPITSSNVGNVSSEDHVSAEEAATRIRIAAEYLSFRLKRMLSANDMENQNKLSVGSYESVLCYLRQLVPKVSTGTYNEDLQGITLEQAETLELGFRPASSTNPFRSGFFQHRNYLIWRFLYETGMRRHELCGIKVGDVDYSSHRVVIRESKTYPRTVPISMTLSELFHDFVMEYWSKLPKTETKHGYLFTNIGGDRLRLNSINLIFSTIIKRLSNSLGDVNVTPHTLRRTWNDRFSEKIDSLQGESKISPEREHQMRVRLMGWSSTSEQAARYGKRHIRKKADEIAETLANDLAKDQTGK